MGRLKTAGRRKWASRHERDRPRPHRQTSPVGLRDHRIELGSRLHGFMAETFSVKSRTMSKPRRVAQSPGLRGRGAGCPCSPPSRPGRRSPPSRRAGPRRLNMDMVRVERETHGHTERIGLPPFGSASTAASKASTAAASSRGENVSRDIRSGSGWTTRTPSRSTTRQSMRCRVSSASRTTSYSSDSVQLIE
jgi:hypothetical protein